MENIFISLGQLAQHSTQRDLWIAVHGKVYDLTAFATDHPGGIDVLEECAGTDGTEPYEYAGHSIDALTVLNRFQVGILEGQSSSPRTRSSTPATTLPLRKDSAATVMRRAWGVARSRNSVILLALFVTARLCWRAGGLETLIAQSDRSMLDPMSTSIVGLAIASMASLAGLAAIYSRFSATLRQEKEVFAYPSVIAVKR